MVDGKLVVLTRGRHRSDGGVSHELNDMAGQLVEIDPNVAEPVIHGRPAGHAVRSNGRVLALPTHPPFHAFDHSRPAEQDTLMDRPYCGLDYDPVSRNLIVCCYSGAELDGGKRFRKHATDALLRFDLRDARWRIVEQHDHSVVPAAAMGEVISNDYYPHHDPATNPPPHGWLNGPNGCAVAGDYLYAVGKDNHLVVRYDLAPVRQSPDAPPPDAVAVLGPRVAMRLPGGEVRDIEVLGACAVAARDGYLYIAYRTSSVVIRLPIADNGAILPGRPAELIAVFEPFNAQAGRSADIFDIELNSKGDLFVSAAREGRIWRLTPDPDRPFYGNDQTPKPTSAPPFVDLAKLLGKKASCGNILIDDQDRLYICTRSDDIGDSELKGTIYRVDAR